MSAEPVKTWEVAVDRLRDVLNLLRYSMPFLFDEARDPDINPSPDADLAVGSVLGGRFWPRRRLLADEPVPVTPRASVRSHRPLRWVSVEAAARIQADQDLGRVVRDHGQPARKRSPSGRTPETPKTA
ncbi:MAG: hypothetical protein M3N18_06130 [Actinomycetota bacterium]|nr:hypothetical protein [Actinomycetota bacterium]